MYLPSSQIKALQEYDALSNADQKITFGYLNHSMIPNPGNTKGEIGSSLSTIAEHLLPREADASKRNFLFSVKRMFPESHNSIKLSGEDPSLSTGLASTSMLFLPKKNAAIFTISPGFIRLENEAASAQKNAVIETLRVDLFADTAGSVRVEKFHIASIESNQPSGYLKDGFTQALDISYSNYRTYLDKSYKETKIMFGRGVGWSIGGYTISTLPLVSIAGYRRNNSTFMIGRVDARLNIYKSINEKFTYAAQIDQLITRNSEIQQTMNFDLVYSIKKNMSISYNSHRIMSKQKTSTLSGFRITASF
jgi:hypothetical protein